MRSRWQGPVERRLKALGRVHARLCNEANRFVAGRPCFTTGM
jgi:hypothetical protein